MYSYLRSINLIQVIFWALTIIIGVSGILVNTSFIAKHVPSSVLQFFRYGRLNYTKIKGNDLLSKFQVPKSWFAHFYLFAILFKCFVITEISRAYFRGNYGTFNSWLDYLLSFIGGNSRVQTVDEMTTALVCFLFLLHVCRRFYETKFISVFSDTKMNAMIYVSSYAYYFFTILSLVAHSPRFSINYNFGEVASWGWNNYQLIGLAIVLYGFLQQYRAHLGFARLRKVDGKHVVSFKHKIPNGGLFDLVSSPNYLAEIIIYVGFAVIFRFRNPTFNAVTACAFASQISTGIMNHKWYLATFPDYPAERKAIIPYLL